MKRILTMASFALAFAGQVHAADLVEPEQPPPEPVVATGGWYLRGDISYDFMNLRGADFFQGNKANNRVDFDSAALDDTGNLGVGVGYQVNDYLRVDTTFDWMFDTDFNGSTHGQSKNTGSACDDGCKSHDTSSLTAYSLMANAYVDVAHYGLFTPYLGAGIGGTYVKWDDLHNTSCSVTHPERCDGTVDHKGREGWRFTYALMAGTAIDINCNLKADVGYRFRHIEGGDMFGYKEKGGPGFDKGLDIHEARAGLRWAFDQGDCAPVYVPPAEMPHEQPVFK